MIKLQVIGHLGRDVAVNNVNGKTVMNFTVAHSERYKDANGNQNERTIWVDCAYWNDNTAISPYLKKGQLVYVEGAPYADAYTTKEGKPGATLRLRVQSIQLLGGVNKDNGGESSGNGENNTKPTPTENPTPKPSETPTAAQQDDKQDVDINSDLPF